MSKHIHKKSLSSIASAGVITFLLLSTGYAEAKPSTASASNQEEISSQAVTKRIEPVGAVSIDSAPKESDKAETTTTPAKDEEKPAPASGEKGNSAKR